MPGLCTSFPVQETWDVPEWIPAGDANFLSIVSLDVCKTAGFGVSFTFDNALK